jgi:dihydrofolate reductase
VGAPTCHVFIATSVDGYIARSDGRIDWLQRAELPGEDYGYARFFAACDVLVLGRKTWETVAGFGAWPYAGKRSVVLTHRPLTPLANEEVFSGSPRALAERLGREGARRVYVDGGAVISQFLAEGLIDELTVTQVPVLLGDGVPLFGPGRPELGLALVESRAFPSGVVQTTWRRA